MPRIRSALLQACMHPTDVYDRRGAERLLTGLKPHLPHVTPGLGRQRLPGAESLAFRDAGLDADDQQELVDWPARGMRVVPGQQSPKLPRGFYVIECRRVLERTFSWIGRNRRVSRGYERRIKTSEMLLNASMTRIMLRRLAK